MAKAFTCERDGAVIRGESDDELVANVERHVRRMQAPKRSSLEPR